MPAYSCSTCGSDVSEVNLKAGMAVREANKVHCFRCVTNRHAKVSDSKVMRAMLARNTEFSMLRQVRRISHRFVAQIPTGNFKRVMRRVSERFVGPATRNYEPIRIMRRQLPAGSCSTIAAVSRARTEAQSLAYACIGGVAISVVGLMAYLAFSPKPMPVSNAPAHVVTAAAPLAVPPAPVVSAQPVFTFPAVTAPHRAALMKPNANASFIRLEEQPQARAAVELDVADTGTVKIPPLLMERENAPVSSADFNAHLSEIRQTSSHKNATLQPVVPAEPLEFAQWEVDNLYKNAKAQALPEFDGYKYVLETHPPEANQELVIRWKLNVPRDRSIVEFCARGADTGSIDMKVELAGKSTPAIHLSGPQWRAFSFDISAYRGQSVALLIHHIPFGFDAQTAYWQTPQFFTSPATDATMLSLGAQAAVAPVPEKSVKPAVRESGISDVKLEYEKTLVALYQVLGSKGASAAQDFLTQAKARPALAPMRGQLDLDERCLGYVDALRSAAVRGARELRDGRAFKMVLADGRECVIGSGAARVLDASEKGVEIEQFEKQARATYLVKLEELSLETQYDLAQLAMPAAEASLNMAMVKLLYMSRSPNAALAREIGTALEKARKLPALAEQAENLQRHLDLFKQRAN